MKPRLLEKFLEKYFSNRYFIIALLIVVGFILYANSFQNQMFWDDDDGILKNQFVQNWRYFPKYFSENLIAGAGLLSNYWRPILLTTFSLEWHFWRDWAPGYHFVNTSFHITDAVLLFFILLYIFKNRWLAILTALVFLVHPLQTEAVTYVSGLGDSLSVFFIFLGILFYLKFRISKKTPPQGFFYFLSLLMYILALMSKETAIVMPFFIFIADFFFLGQNGNSSLKDKFKKIGKAIWPFLALAGVYILLRATVLNFKNTFNLYDEENLFTSNFHIRLLTFFRILTVYFGLLFWPFNLHMERGIEIATSLNSFSVILGSLLFFSLLALAFSQFKRFPILSFGIFWFFIGLAPTSNLLVPISGLLYEHWLYLPLIGIFLILFWLGEIVARRYNFQKIFLGILIIFLVFLSILTVNRNKDWRDPITFYNQTLKYVPTSYRVINNLGMAYADIDDHRKAEETYKKAITLEPSNLVAYHNLGNTYKAIGKKDLAIENFKTAILLDPKFFFSYNALLGIYLEDKNYQEAKEMLERYLEIDPGNQDIQSYIIYLENLIKSEK
jgi:tetratricopeptide (TPR) repeat protein